MKRRWFAVLGGCFLVVAVLAAVVLRRSLPESPRLAVGVVTWAVVGGLSIVGGLRASVRGVEWYRFVGASDVLIGIWMIGYGVTTYLDGPTDRVVLLTAVAMAVGGITLGLIGIEWFRGGRHFDIAAYESGPILGRSDG